MDAEKNERELKAAMIRSSKSKTGCIAIPRFCVLKKKVTFT